MMDDIHPWQLFTVGALLVVEWWLPRQKRFDDFDSILDLAHGAIVALFGLLILVLFWRKKK